MTPDSAYHTEESRWEAVVTRDRRAAERFCYAVSTTGIFCRPGCGSRLPKRENVEFFATCTDAEAAGYRPCKRCRPGAPPKHEEHERAIVKACRSIERGEAPVALKDLATAAGMSPYHFHRLFKKIVGVTPKQYASARQAQRFRTSLKSRQTVTEAIYEAGYSSSGRAYDPNQDRLAMEPQVFRDGAPGRAIRYGIARCFLGWVIVAATERGICAVEFGDDPDTLPDQLRETFPKAQIAEAGSEFTTLLRVVVDFIETPAAGFSLPLDIRGTAFQLRVWQVLRRIRPGSTATYTEVARLIGNPRAVRAVARACASNKLAVVIPCHRVVAKNGSLSGYRWGVERKRRLLDKESGESRE